MGAQTPGSEGGGAGVWSEEGGLTSWAGHLSGQSQFWETTHDVALPLRFKGRGLGRGYDPLGGGGVLLQGRPLLAWALSAGH